MRGRSAAVQQRQAQSEDHAAARHRLQVGRADGQHGRLTVFAHVRSLWTLENYRWEMTHFVHTLEGFVFMKVLEANWAEFTERLAQVTTLRELMEAHQVRRAVQRERVPGHASATSSARHAQNFVSRCSHGCFQHKSAQAVYNVVAPIFTAVLEFIELVVKLDPDVRIGGETRWQLERTVSRSRRRRRGGRCCSRRPALGARGRCSDR
jgi:hypothetical protein